MGKPIAPKPMKASLSDATAAWGLGFRLGMVV